MTQESSYIAAPWQFDRYDETSSFCGAETYPDYDFRVEYSPHVTEAQRASTDSLIAAAPELLEALENLLDKVNATHPQGPNYNEFNLVYCSGRAAIAKAKDGAA